MENKSSMRIVMGAVAFLVGIGLLVIVFLMSYSLFNSEFILPKDAQNKDIIGLLTNYGVSFLVKVVTLFIMTIVASILSNKGISLIFKDEVKKN